MTMLPERYNAILLAQASGSTGERRIWGLTMDAEPPSDMLAPPQGAWEQSHV